MTQHEQRFSSAPWGRTAPRPVVVVRRRPRAGRAGGRGGGWKIAYADFVTAMMAFFLVMWIMGMDEESRSLVQGYFNDPNGVQESFQGHQGAEGALPGVLPDPDIALQQQRFEAIIRSFQLQLAEEVPGGSGAAVEMSVTAEGLRIELRELSPDEVLFERSASTVSLTLRRILRVLAPELATIPNAVAVEGHTDGTPFVPPSSAYGNWELSTDRANAVRRVLVLSGLPRERISEVRGYADRRPWNPRDPLDPQNRRVSLVLPYVTPPGGTAFRETSGAGSPTPVSRILE